MQHLKACLLAVILTASSLVSVRAQEAAEAEEPAAARREIGFGTNIILGPVFSSGSSPLDLMYRWGNEQRLFRLGTSLAYHTSTNHWNNLRDNNQQDYIRTELFLGREWRAEVAGRWLVNYGGDINFTYSQYGSRHEYTRGEEQGNTLLEVQYNSTQTIGGGLRPFIGIIFKINDHLLLGTEASFLAGIQNYLSSYERYTLENDVRTDEYQNYEREDARWNVNIRTQPASNIFVYYSF